MLGSGLGAFADRLDDATRVPYTEIPHWPASTVIGHAGTLVCGASAGRRVLTLAGRAHFYEGHDLRTVTFATRVLGRLGVKTLVLTNAAGGINTSFTPGTLMVIDDHINLMGSNPLVGPNDDRFGVRFPDMTAVYAPRLRAIADEAARRLPASTVRHGIYVGLHGPSYETPAEIRFLRAIGADAVGMSTVPEAIVARHMGIEVLGHLLHHQPGGRRAARAAAPRRGDGGGAPRERRVHGAAGGDRCPALIRWSSPHAARGRNAVAPYSGFKVGAALLTVGRHRRRRAATSRTPPTA